MRRPRAERAGWRWFIAWVHGNCSTPDTNNRWPDHIAERLQAEGHPDVAVVNEAYSGDRVLTSGIGTNALSRFDISVLSHPRVSTVVMMMMGINDIGWPGKGAITPSDPEPTAEDVIAGFKQIIDRAHEHGLRFVGSRSRRSLTRSRASQHLDIIRPKRNRSARRSTSGFAPTRRPTG